MAKFEQRFGYSPVRFLPCLNGRVVDSADVSTRFLWDWRRLVAESIARDYVGGLKRWCDWVYGTGVNHLILHVFIHQPDDKPPGIIQWFGTAFNRHNTWFEQSKAFIDYTRRSSVLLKTGLPVVDVAYYIGENAPAMTGPRDPELPNGYDYDFINSDALIHRAGVKDNKITIKDGPTYAVLVLPKQEVMRPEVAEAIKRLVRDGATILGPKPVSSPSLAAYPSCDQAVAAIATELWGDVNGDKIKTRKFGKGTVCDGVGLDQVLADIGRQADVRVIGDKLLCSAAGAGKIGLGKRGGIVFKHRTAPDREVYFLANTSNAAADFTASLRVAGRMPTLWNANTGQMTNVDAFTQKDGRTLIPLHLEASESIFVVFSKTIDGKAKGPATSNTPDYAPP